MARALMAVGVAPDRAYSLARRVGDDLETRSSDVVELDRLEALAIERLGEVEGREALRQLRRYQQLRELDLPIVILVGGATGTGKSTVATEIMPSIHYSSFEAGLAVPEAEDPLVAGFLEQSRQVLVGARASLDRALQEGWSMVLEGVHLVPGLLPSALEETLVTACVLKIDDETAHAQHFFTRDAGTDRPMAKYLDRFREIRSLQDFIVGRAEREGVTVIENDSAERSTRAVAELVLSAAERAREHV
jgi:2-phosphoglycerate kinase